MEGEESNPGEDVSEDGKLSLQLGEAPVGNINDGTAEFAYNNEMAETIAHELGHAMGQFHTNDKNAPEDAKESVKSSENLLSENPAGTKLTTGQTQQMLNHVKENDTNSVNRKLNEKDEIDWNN